jgi:hypothetical protein
MWMRGARLSAHDKSSVPRVSRLGSLSPPLAAAEARVAQVEIELRLTLAEGLLSELEMERDQLNAELAEVRSERDAWKMVATRLLLAPKRSWWSLLAAGRR